MGAKAYSHHPRICCWCRSTRSLNSSLVLVRIVTGGSYDLTSAGAAILLSVSSPVWSLSRLSYKDNTNAVECMIKAFITFSTTTFTRRLFFMEGEFK